MSLVIGPRLVDSGAGASDESAPGALSPEGVVRSEQNPPDSRSHLVACRHCGTLNGRSATVCWGCEISLATRRRPKAESASESDLESLETEEPAADTAAEGDASGNPAQDAEPVASATSDAGNDTDPAHLASAANDPSITQAVRAPMSAGRRWATAGGVVLAAVAVAGAYLHFSATPPSEGVAASAAPNSALRAEGTVAGAEPAAGVNAGAAGRAVDPTVREALPPAARSAPAATVQALFGDSGSAADPEPDAASHSTPPPAPAGPAYRPPRADASTAAAPAGRHARPSRRAARAATTHAADEASPAPASEATVPSPQAPAPAPGPCTTQVAALGLCTSSSSSAKE